MRRIFKLKYQLLLLCLFVSVTLLGQQLAFPSAQGFGAFSVGGRGGTVIEVTNLNDAGTGSLRAAIESNGPRTIVFRLSGTIELKSMLTITNPFITIAGQTAPGDGICLKNYPLHIQSHDVIVRCIRIRPGIGSGMIGSEIDGIEVRSSQNVILDHCTVSWTVDEGVNTWHNTENITMQWCMIAEPLNHSVHEKGPHGYAASLGGKRASYLHNLIADAAGRNPSVAGNNLSMTEDMDFRNNVVFNYGHRTCDGKPVSINFVGNYYKPGPATHKEILHRLVRIDNAQKYGFDSHWYIADNVIEGYPEALEDNWKNAVEWDKGTDPKVIRQDKPFEIIQTKTETAEKAYQDVMQNVGVIAPHRDYHELRVLGQVAGQERFEGTGIIDNVEQVGGWPTLKSKTPPADSDHDGMPDHWEKEHGLNPTNAADGNKDRDGDGYTNLEEYLNSLIVLQ